MFVTKQIQINSPTQIHQGEEENMRLVRFFQIHLLYGLKKKKVENTKEGEKAHEDNYAFKMEQGVCYFINAIEKLFVTMQILLVLRSAINLIRLKKAVVIMFMIYCSERIQTTGSKGKRRGDCARGKQWELAEAFPPGVARDMLTRPSKGL